MSPAKARQRRPRRTSMVPPRHHFDYVCVGLTLTALDRLRQEDDHGRFGAGRRAVRLRGERMRWDALFEDLEQQWDAQARRDLDGEVADRTRRERAAIGLQDRL